MQVGPLDTNYCKYEFAETLCYLCDPLNNAEGFALALLYFVIISNLHHKPRTYRLGQPTYYFSRNTGTLLFLQCLQLSWDVA